MHYKIEILNLICCYNQKKTNSQYSHFGLLPIYKKESGCIPPRFGDTLLKSAPALSVHPHSFCLLLSLILFSFSFTNLNLFYVLEAMVCTTF